MLYVMTILLLLKVLHCHTFAAGWHQVRLFSSVRHMVMKDSTDKLKADLLTLARKVNKGLTESERERNEVRRLFDEIEKRNLRNDTLSSPDLSAVWSLEYTTSNSLLQRGSSVTTVGPILQTIDTRDSKDLRAENKEVRMYPVGPFKLKVPFKVEGTLTPVTPPRVNVKFELFTVGILPIPAPRGDIFTSWLDITYLDRDLRLSRGAKGNIFVLSRYGELE